MIAVVGAVGAVGALGAGDAFASEETLRGEEPRRRREASEEKIARALNDSQSIRSANGEVAPQSLLFREFLFEKQTRKEIYRLGRRADQGRWRFTR